MPEAFAAYALELGWEFTWNYVPEWVDEEGLAGSPGERYEGFWQASIQREETIAGQVWMHNLTVPASTWELPYRKEVWQMHVSLADACFEAMLVEHGVAR